VAEAKEKPKKRKRRRSPRTPGYSANRFANEVGSSPAVIRSLIAAGLIDTVDVNGRKRIPPREKPRYFETWGEPA
jgi:hypothetical protein